MLGGLGRLFMVSSLSSGFSVVGFHSRSLRLFLFFPCFPWYRRTELISWRFGPFYLEFCGSSLAWASCFSLWGASYLLAGGWAFGALGMCLPTSCWLWHFGHYFSSDLLSWFFALVLYHTHLCSEDCFVSDFIFLLFFWLLIILAKTFCSKMR